MGRKLFGRALTAALSLLTAGTMNVVVRPAEAVAAAPFKVLAFYNGTWDAAHIAFVNEANPWLTRAGQENGFTYESTRDWNRLNTLTALRLDHAGTKGALHKKVTDPRFDVPTTIAAYGHRLYLPNARFNTTPEPDTTYTVTAVRS